MTRDRTFDEQQQPLSYEPILGSGFDALNDAHFIDELSQVDLLQRLLSEPVAQMNLFDFDFAAL